MELFRQRVIDHLKAELVGPADSEHEVINGKPFHRYMCGILFPQDQNLEQLGESAGADGNSETVDDEVLDPSLGMAYADLPSSMGVSFFLSDCETLVCRPKAARYIAVDPGDKETPWRRSALNAGGLEEVRINAPTTGQRSVEMRSVLQGWARMHAVFRPRQNGHLVTVSLVNAKKASGLSMYDAEQISAMLFQCSFEVECLDGHIGEYPQVADLARHEEDEELALAYRRRITYGIGHGCAATWESSGGEGRVGSIKAEPVPVTEVKALTNEIKLPESAQRVLSVQWLGNPKVGSDELKAALEAFVDCYAEWVAEQEKLANALEQRWKAPTLRLVGKQRISLDRMRTGIRILVGDNDPHILESFRLAQQAMLRQFLWRRRSGFPKKLGEGDTTCIDIWSEKYAESPKWRPFQFAFQLLVLESLSDPHSKYRETMDLLWFPTGGGKTEAYLLLAAFEILRRRLKYGSAGGGTAVLMRYTLRLLTAQQFERSATLISVLERMRQEDAEKLGDMPIRIGLWVGGENTPNRLDSDHDRQPGAVQILDALLDDARPENPFQLTACPCCGTRLIPEIQSPRDHYGVFADQYRFSMNCPDPECELHESIPVSVVDEDLFRNPPTFLVGTIDKFARMAWDPRSRVFLGHGNGGSIPPSLVIQDELHLITGPLGTISGVYEAAVDTVIQNAGVLAKYIAATATIQRAQEQSRALYARDAMVFPSPGLECEDSFFSREDKEASGRKFVGAMGNAMFSPLTSLIQASYACAAAAMRVKPDLMAKNGRSRARDAYWTQVIYHNSRQELGKTTTMLQDDVRKRLEILAPDVASERAFDKIQELSANLKGREIGDALERIAIEWPRGDAIDVLACTNMISVGVDISRLGLMIVKGQPKATSEYIQASSRVGRDLERPGGIVLALYSPTRPRDRSHYESFQSYHQKLYKEVEPVTVTPFAPPALDRTMHAALVIAVRLSLGWMNQDDAKRFDPATPAVKAVLDRLKARLIRACRDDEKEEVAIRFEEVVQTWRSEVERVGPPLTFAEKSAQFRRLLGDFEERNAVWPTLNSMRHVDGETPFYIAGSGKA